MFLGARTSQDLHESFESSQREVCYAPRCLRKHAPIEATDVFEVQQEKLAPVAHASLIS